MGVPRRAVAQFGSALDWGSRGRRFESCQPDHGDQGSRPWSLVVGGRICGGRGATSRHAATPPTSLDSRLRRTIALQVPPDADYEIAWGMADRGARSLQTTDPAD